MNFEKYKDKGLSGLSNLGNTCFINSCIQLLSHTYELNDFLDLETYKNKLNNKYDSALLIQWDELRKILWNENCIVSPNKFVNTVQKIAQIKGMEIFTGFSQNDLPEFLLFVIDCFHNSILREVDITISGIPKNDTDTIALKCFEMVKRMYTKEYSEIWNLFYGVHVSQIISNKEDQNKVLSVNPEPFFMVNLSIPENNKSPNLYDCFDLYVKGEMLEGENAWYNEETKEKENVKKQISFWSFPNILAIDLKRFNSSQRKKQILVNFPIENLDLSKYVIGYKSETFVYDLYGIANHSGGVLGGHYTAFVKNANGKWYHFNDTLVNEIKNVNELITPKAYCLLYRKRKT